MREMDLYMRYGKRKSTTKASSSSSTTTKTTTKTAPAKDSTHSTSTMNNNVGTSGGQRRNEGEGDKGSPGQDNDELKAEKEKKGRVAMIIRISCGVLGAAILVLVAGFVIHVEKKKCSRAVAVGAAEPGRV